MAGKNPVFNYAFDDDEQKFQDEASKGFAPIPRGWYHVVITDVALSDYEAPSKYVGKKRLTLAVKVLGDDEYTGRKVRYIQVPLFPRWAPSAKKPEGTATSFRDLLAATGLLVDGKVTVKDWNVLFNQEVAAYIDLDPKDDGRVFNTVKSFAGQWKALDEAEFTEGGNIEFGEPETESPY